jgi:hypothetical protein
LVARDGLAPVVRGLYLNRFTSPAGRLADAVPHLRRDAVVSLHSALDEAGAVEGRLDLDHGTARPRATPEKASISMNGIGVG